MTTLQSKQADAEKRARTFESTSVFHRDSKDEAIKCAAMAQALEEVIIAQEKIAAKRGEKRTLLGHQPAECQVTTLEQIQAEPNYMPPAKHLKPGEAGPAPPPGKGGTSEK